MSTKRLIEAWAIVEAPQVRPVGLTTVPMRKEDVEGVWACAVFMSKEAAEKVLAKTKYKGVQIVPCFVTYNEPDK